MEELRVGDDGHVSGGAVDDIHVIGWWERYEEDVTMTETVEVRRGKPDDLGMIRW